VAMGLFKHSRGVVLPDVRSDVQARGHVYFQDELRSIGQKRHEFRLVPDPSNEHYPDTVNIYDGETRVGWLGVGRAHDNRAYGEVLKQALPKVVEVRVVGNVRRQRGPGIQYEWSIDLRAPDPATAATILGVKPPKAELLQVDVKLTRDKASREAVGRLLVKDGATQLDNGRLVSELTPSGKYKWQVRLRCEVAGEIVGHATAAMATEIPEVFKRAALGPVRARVVIRYFNETPYSAATAFMD